MRKALIQVRSIIATNFETNTLLESAEQTWPLTWGNPTTATLGLPSWHTDALDNWGVGDMGWGL